MPAPGAYSPNPNNIDSKRTSMPKFGFGSMKRPNINKESIGPGPGAYSLPSKMAENAGYIMGSKLKDLP